MPSPLKTGDLAQIVCGSFEEKSPNMGKCITVGKFKGRHSVHGPIWEVHGSGLISEYGAKGNTTQCAQDWLKKIEPPERTSTKTETKTLVHD